MSRTRIIGLVFIGLVLLCAGVLDVSVVMKGVE